MTNDQNLSEFFLNKSSESAAAAILQFKTDARVISTFYVPRNYNCYCIVRLEVKTRNLVNCTNFAKSTRK